MKKTIVILSAVLFLLSLTVFASKASARATQNKTTQSSKVCYAINAYPTDFLILNIVPGNNIVTGRYRQCVEGTDPGTGSADALMVGTMQDVPEANTIPYAQGSVQTQISLVGSLASGNFQTPVQYLAKRCFVHLAFDDSSLSTGRFFGQCEWWSFDGTTGVNNLTIDDKDTSLIERIDCSEVLLLDGSCSVD